MTPRRALAVLTLLCLASGLMVAPAASAIAPTQPQFVAMTFLASPTLGDSFMSSKRVGAAAAVSGGKVFIAGGSAGTGTPPTTIDEYDPTTTSQGTFKTLTAQLTTARQFGYAAPLPGGKVLFGGGTNASAVDLDTAEIFDPASGTDTPVTAHMTTARREAWAAPLPNGSVLIGGGIDANNNIVDTAEIFDPTTQTFTATPHQMVDALAGATATALPDGRVLIVGGATSTTVPPSTAVELYDPTTGVFTKASDALLVPRNGPLAVTLPDGQVLVAGGLSSAISSPAIVERSAEIFDPEDLSSQELPTSGSTELTLARYAPVAATLPNGRVLIAGGGDASGNAFSTGELFESAPEAQVPPPQFSDTVVGTTSTLSVTITNVGAQSLDVEGFSLGGPNSSDFSVGTSTCPGNPFDFQSSCTVNLHFTPSATGSRVGIVTLSDNEPVPLTFIVKGNGTNKGGGTTSGPPVLSKASITPGRFHAGKHATGAKIAWRDTSAATTTLRILQVASGRKVHGRCVATTHGNRHKPSCSRVISRGSLTHADQAGPDTLTFKGLLKGRTLAPGHYRVTLQAANAQGRSQLLTLKFTVTG
ncbi:MAG TPA: choice-of-anchor D domain-containing protein [Solirubrobacteraceae bacterium]|nr:choice-of-anchor D domain-containing protein [Solirubrobacteraceae bacterium]